MNKIIIILVGFLCFICISLSSQNKVELLNKGNEFYQSEDYNRAEYYYKQALTTNMN